MAVKGDAPKERPDAADATGTPRSALDSVLFELLRVMPRVFRGLRQGDPEQCEPGVKRAASPGELFKGGALGPRHIPVIVVLMLEGPMAVSDLAHRLGLNIATVSLMVGELARAELVERHEDEQDRRRTMVSVAERHRVRFDPFVRERLAPLRRGLQRMNPEIRSAFVQGWRVLAEEFGPDRPPANSGKH